MKNSWDKHSRELHEN